MFACECKGGQKAKNGGEMTFYHPSYTLLSPLLSPAQPFTAKDGGRSGSKTEGKNFFLKNKVPKRWNENWRYGENCIYLRYPSQKMMDNYHSVMAVHHPTHQFGVGKAMQNNIARNEKYQITAPVNAHSFRIGS
jgi:hypothetical protein